MVGSWYWLFQTTGEDVRHGAMNVVSGKRNPVCRARQRQSRGGLAPSATNPHLRLEGRQHVLRPRERPNRIEALNEGGSYHVGILSGCELGRAGMAPAHVMAVT